MQSYASVTDLIETVRSSAEPLRRLTSGDGAALWRQLNQLAVKDPRQGKLLEDLSTRLLDAVPELEKAEAIRENNTPDVVMQQANAIATLHKAGLSRNFMLAIPVADTNAGGNLSQGRNGRSLSPVDGVRKMGEAIAYLVKNIPGVVISVTADGGRDQANGDSSRGATAFLIGPADKVKTTFLEPYPTYAQIGTEHAQLTLSNGQTVTTASPGQWYSTTLRAMGVSVDVPYVPDVLNV
jgi:hypothetical protein